jgi:hypothetical protein
MAGGGTPRHGGDGEKGNDPSNPGPHNHTIRRLRYDAATSAQATKPGTTGARRVRSLLRAKNPVRDNNPQRFENSCLAGDYARRPLAWPPGRRHALASCAGQAERRRGLSWAFAGGLELGVFPRPSSCPSGRNGPSPHHAGHAVRSDPRPGPPRRAAVPSRLARRGEACEPAGVPTKPVTAAPDAPPRGEPVARTVCSGVPALAMVLAR